jgi:flagellar basal body-associated protein FliL
MNVMDGSGKNKLMLIIIIVLLVIMLGVIGALVFFLLGDDGGDPDDIILGPAVTMAPGINEQVTFPIGTNMVRNLRIPPGSTSRGWYLQFSISVEIDGRRDPDGELVDTMTEKIDLARDVVNRVIGNLTYDDLRAVNGEEAMAERVLEALSYAFNTNLILRVNFPSIQYLPVP